MLLGPMSYRSLTCGRDVPPSHSPLAERSCCPTAQGCPGQASRVLDDVNTLACRYSMIGRSGCLPVQAKSNNYKMRLGAVGCMERQIPNFHNLRGKVTPELNETHADRLLSLLLLVLALFASCSDRTVYRSSDCSEAIGIWRKLERSHLRDCICLR